MAEHTPNYDLIKPTTIENAFINDINDNMDIIDGQMYDNEQAIQENAEAINEVDGKVNDLIITRDYTFNVSYDVGTIGTRGYTSNQNIAVEGYTPINACIKNTSSSANYIITPILNNNILYCIAYRTKTSAQTEQEVELKVMYIKDS